MSAVQLSAAMILSGFIRGKCPIYRKIFTWEYPNSYYTLFYLNIRCYKMLCFDIIWLYYMLSYWLILKDRGRFESCCDHQPKKVLVKSGTFFFFVRSPGVQNEHADRVHFFDMIGLCSCTCSHRVNVNGLAVRVASLLVFDVNRLPARVASLPVFDVNGSLARCERLAG